MNDDTKDLKKQEHFILAKAHLEAFKLFHYQLPDNQEAENEVINEFITKMEDFGY